MLDESDLSELVGRLRTHIEQIYPGQDSREVATRLVEEMRYPAKACMPPPNYDPWDQSDLVLITYANSIFEETEKPLVSLKRFLDERLSDLVSIVHILPFYPFSSDDGFSVIDYEQVNPQLGDWDDVRAISSEYRLMADLVINHCSRKSEWFENFIKGESPGRGYFFTASPAADLSDVIRPRASDLLYPVETAEGVEFVWCTFSHDQIDLNFGNLEVLYAFVRIIRHYLSQGVRVFRLDAIAFLWKEVGTTCLNLPQTHEMVRLIRALVEYYDREVLLITETNIPDRENLTYFGNGNEAHMVYNFPLPPLLLHTLWSGDAAALNRWIMSLPPAQMGTTYFNFIASHDGIGMRPVEELLDEEAQEALVQTAQRLGGKVSWRALSEHQLKPYELNISLYDAFGGTHDGPDELAHERMVCAHSIMLSLEGIPAFYIHSLLGTRNDYEKLDRLGQSRAINRHNWIAHELETQLADPSSPHSRLFEALARLIRIRKRQPAFHPSAVQYTLQLGPGLFGVWRQSLDRRQSIFALANVSDKNVVLPLGQLNLISIDDWADLVSGNAIEERGGQLQLAPYQACWLSNRDGCDDIAVDQN